MAKEWEKFSVGLPSDKSNWTEPTCRPLASVAHVAHVPIALRIVEDQRLERRTIPAGPLGNQRRRR
jgi:hypothetical protein